MLAAPTSQQWVLSGFTKGGPQNAITESPTNLSLRRGVLHRQGLQAVAAIKQRYHERSRSCSDKLVKLTRSANRWSRRAGRRYWAFARLRDMLQHAWVDAFRSLLHLLERRSDEKLNESGQRPDLSRAYRQLHIAS
jgi:hypothetical protein